MSDLSHQRPQRMTKYLPLAALLVGAVLGWVLHKKACPAIASVNQVLANPQTAIWEAIVGDLSKRLKAKDDSITKASQRVLALDKSYRDELLRIARKEHDDSVQMASLEASQDWKNAAAKCSVVVRDCEQRAALAEQRVDALQQQLGAQVRVASRRCGLSAGVIPLRVDFPFKPHVGASFGILAGCQIW